MAATKNSMHPTPLAPPPGTEPTGRGPTSLLQAEPGWTPWAKVRPPGTLRHVPSSGQAPGRGLDNPRPGKGDLVPFLVSIIRGLWGYALSVSQRKTGIHFVLAFSGAHSGA